MFRFCYLYSRRSFCFINKCTNQGFRLMLEPFLLISLNKIYNYNFFHIFVMPN